jgi:hypothetical protein
VCAAAAVLMAISACGCTWHCSHGTIQDVNTAGKEAASSVTAEVVDCSVGMGSIRHRTGVMSLLLSDIIISVSSAPVSAAQCHSAITLGQHCKAVHAGLIIDLCQLHEAGDEYSCTMEYNTD